MEDDEDRFLNQAPVSVPGVRHVWDGAAWVPDADDFATDAIAEIEVPMATLRHLGDDNVLPVEIGGVGYVIMSEAAWLELRAGWRTANGKDA